MFPTPMPWYMAMTRFSSTGRCRSRTCPPARDRWHTEDPKLPPVDEVGADGVAPVLAGVLRRPRLVEQVPAALQEAQPVGVVQRVLGVDEVIAGAMRVVRLHPTRLPHPLQQRIAPELVFLPLQRVGKRKPRDSRRRKLDHCACIARFVSTIDLAQVSLPYFSESIPVSTSLTSGAAIGTLVGDGTDC